MFRTLMLAALTAAALCVPAAAQIAAGRAPQWAQNLLAADLIASTGGRAQLQNEGVEFAVRVTLAPYQGGVARVVRIEGSRTGATLFLRRFTGHPSAGWWLWGPETPAARPLTAAQRAQVETLASGAIASAAAPQAACPQGEQAYVEIFSRGRSTVFSRACLGEDGGSRLARAASDLAGSRTEGELHEAAIAELLDADRAFNAMAQEEGIAAAFAQFADEGALFFNPRQEPARTPAARAAVWAGWSASDRLEWSPQEAQVSARGDMGWTWGNAVRSSAGQPPSPSRYVTVWKRNYDGAWRFVADIAVPGPPLPAAPRR